MKVLLVDDDAFLRDMYATKFTESGHTVSVMPDGASALEDLQNNTYDVIVLDMVMPGISGTEFIEKAKDFSHATFIVLSNQGEDSDKKVATDAGAVGYIVKAESIPSAVVKTVEELVETK